MAFGRGSGLYPLQISAARQVRLLYPLPIFSRRFWLGNSTKARGYGSTPCRATRSGHRIAAAKCLGHVSTQVQILPAPPNVSAVPVAVIKASFNRVSFSTQESIMKELTLDCPGWTTNDDVYSAFFHVIGAAKWHGRNFDKRCGKCFAGQLCAQPPTLSLNVQCSMNSLEGRRAS